MKKPVMLGCLAALAMVAGTAGAQACWDAKGYGPSGVHGYTYAPGPYAYTYSYAPRTWGYTSRRWAYGYAPASYYYDDYYGYGPYAYGYGPSVGISVDLDRKGRGYRDRGDRRDRVGRADRRDRSVRVSGPRANVSRGPGRGDFGGRGGDGRGGNRGR